MSVPAIRLPPKPLTCNVYIDGYNFYYSINKRDHQYLKLGWCDFSQLSALLVETAFPGARIGAVKYFTAAVGELQVNHREACRQRIWLQALEFGSRSQVQVITGYHAKDEQKGRVEKQTDTNIAISLVRDALMSPRDPRHARYSGRDVFAPCNLALLLSGDNDLLPPAEMVGSYGIEVAIFYPVDDEGNRQAPINSRINLFKIQEDDLRASMLPDSIQKPDGAAITWRDYLRLKIESKEASSSVDPD